MTTVFKQSDKAEFASLFLTDPPIYDKIVANIYQQLFMEVFYGT